jgi:hypothetical protein
VTTEKMPPFPILEIVSFVDVTTAVLVGPHVEMLKERDELYVLGIGATKVPKANVPLISAKVTLIVTFPAGPYALAQTPIETERVPSGLAALVYDVGTATRRVQRPLTKEENLFLGDPGKQPVKVGDTVIRKADLIAFIKYRAEQAAV